MAEINFSSSELIKKGMSGTPTEQKVGKFVMGLILAAITTGILYFVGKTGVFTSIQENVFDPIVNISSDLLRIGIYALAGVLGFMFVKAQWRNIGYFNDYLARKAFNGIITYDPFLHLASGLNSTLAMSVLFRPEARCLTCSTACTTAYYT